MAVPRRPASSRVATWEIFLSCLKRSSLGCIKNWLGEYERLSIAESHLPRQPRSVSSCTLPTGSRRVLKGYELTEEEKSAALNVDVRKLYTLGVHSLLLRPFTWLHKISNEDYAKALAGLE